MFALMPSGMRAALLCILLAKYLTFRAFFCSERGACVDLCVPHWGHSQTVRLGILPSADTLALHVAVEEGIFAEQGLEIELVATSYANPGSRHFGVAFAPKHKGATLDALRGAQVAVSRATVIDFLLESMLIRNGLGAEYFTRLDIR